MFELFLWRHRTVAADDVIPVCERLGAQRIEQKAAGCAEVVFDYIDFFALCEDGVLECDQAVWCDAAQKADAFGTGLFPTRLKDTMGDTRCIPYNLGRIGRIERQTVGVVDKRTGCGDEAIGAVKCAGDRRRCVQDIVSIGGQRLFVPEIA